jgi:hypothetical protein
MPRVVRERPRRTVAAALAVTAVLAVGWVVGVGAAGSAPRPRPRITTVGSTPTKTVTHTVTIAPRRPDHRSERSRAVAAAQMRPKRQSK